MKQAYVFPGQGSQAVGMGQALASAFPDAKQVFQEVDDTLDQHLSTLMFEGPEDELTLTQNAQPAIMACSVAVLRVLQKEVGLNVTELVSAVAGHSLGEYSALVCADVLSIADAARLLRVRGNAMQEAVPAGQGGMAAIIGLPISEVEALCTDIETGGEACQVANDNSDAQIVISGTKSAIEQAIEKAKAKGAKRALPLPVSAPFHSEMMQPAAEKMQEALALATMNDATIPVVANVTALPEQSAERIRELLVMQVTGKVRWRETMQWFVEEEYGVITELGHGKVLTGLLKRAVPDATLINIASPEDIEAIAKAA